MFSSEIKIGMKFKSYIDFSNFAGYEYTNSRVIMRNRLKHHCEFHKEGNTIIIDAVKNVDSMYRGRVLNFVYNINDIIEISTGKVKVLNRFQNNTGRRFYKCECLNDGYIYDISQNSLQNGTGCQVCVNKVVLKGVNDIATTRPEIAKLFKNQEETFIYTQFSGKQIEFQCPICGNIKKMKITTVSHRGHIQCNQCCDHFSYPNKFVYSALRQVCQDIKCEAVFEWSNKKRYDLYSKKHNLLIENQGGFHYKNDSKNEKMYNVSFSEIHKNDIYKKNLALNNGIKNYVELDCQKSEAKYIKESILSSTLPEILGFNEDNINWLKCAEFATTSMVYEVLNAYKNGITNRTQLSKMFGISYNTCVRYLNRSNDAQDMDKYTYT